jgi:tRNA pseudouridine38-40 synthase
MVRTIAGTLVDVGLGRRPASWMDEVLASCDRRAAGQTAPASGLFLVAVDYGRQLASDA